MNYIGSLLSVISLLTAKPEAMQEDKQVLGEIKMMLIGLDVSDVERDLAAGVVKTSTLGKIVKINKDMTDRCLDHTHMNVLVREFLRQMPHFQIEYNKQAKIHQLHALRIPITEDWLDDYKVKHVLKPTKLAECWSIITSVLLLNLDVIIMTLQKIQLQCLIRLFQKKKLLAFQFERLTVSDNPVSVNNNYHTEPRSCIKDISEEVKDELRG